MYMGILTGFLCLLCFLLLFIKILTHRLHLERADRILLKVHKYICTLFLVLIPIHIVLVFPVWKMRNIYVQITGICAAVMLILIIIVCHIVRDKVKNIFLHRILSVFMLFCIIFHIAIYYIDFNHYQKNINSIHIQGIDLSETADGQYTGEYNAGYISVKVEVTILNSSITNIQILKHLNERGGSAEKITDQIIKEQRTDVDAISGATNSSSVIKKAVENALLE